MALALNNLKRVDMPLKKKKKRFKQSKQDMSGTAREVRTNSSVTFCYGLQHMDVPVFANQQKLTYINFL